MAKFHSGIEHNRVLKATAAGRRSTYIEWKIREVVDSIALTMRARVKIATELIHSRVVINISKPVGRNAKGRVIQRSKPGEYPRAETTQLMKSVESWVQVPRRRVAEGIIQAKVIAPGGADYAAILEKWKKLDRNYLIRTLNENRALVIKVLTGPIK